jgi:hypothetical protein
MDRVTVSLIVAPILFTVVTLFTRAPPRRIAAALAGGVAFAIGNVGWDVLAERSGWWWYPGFADPSHGPPLWYAAAGLSASGVGLLGWLAYRLFGAKGVGGFLVAFTIAGVVRDYRVAHAPASVITFGSGLVPWLADAAGWFTLMVLALGIQLALGGDVAKLRGVQGPRAQDV